MTHLKNEWQKIFKYVVSIAKDSCKKNTSLTYPQAVKRAWKDPRVMIKRKEYEKKKAAHDAKPAKKIVVKRTVKTVKKVPTKVVVRVVSKKVVRKVPAKKTIRVVAKK